MLNCDTGLPESIVVVADSGFQFDGHWLMSNDVTCSLRVGCKCVCLCVIVSVCVCVCVCVYLSVCV